MKFADNPQIPKYPYPELREVLNVFVDEVAAELKENLVGIYLVGSIASGDFDLDSDVDFLVVTNTELTEANMKSLQDIQTRIHEIDCYPAKHLEGSYISMSDLNDWGTVGKKTFIILITVAPHMSYQLTTINGMFDGFFGNVELLWSVKNLKQFCKQFPQTNCPTK